jgi:hypothetical protein
MSMQRSPTLILLHEESTQKPIIICCQKIQIIYSNHHCWNSQKFFRASHNLYLYKGALISIEGFAKIARTGTEQYQTDKKLSEPYCDDTFMLLESYWL